MKTVLIIDDNEQVRNVVKTTLNEFGFTTFEAADGHEGVEMALSHLPDLIICDLNMNGLDGYGTLEAVREISLLASTPFIIMTGDSGMDVMRRGMIGGADDYLMKPFQPHELIEAVVSRLVRHAQLQAEVERRAAQLRDDALRKISSELASPLNDMMGAARSLHHRAPSEDTQLVYANACRLTDSMRRFETQHAAQATK
jgi:CheY-like chemotaxis protein